MKNNDCISISNSGKCGIASYFMLFTLTVFEWQKTFEVEFIKTKKMKNKITFITNGVKNMTYHLMIRKLKSLNYDGHKLKLTKQNMS